MTDSTKTPSTKLCRRRGRLEIVLRFADDLVRSEGSTTSSYFDRWCEIERTAAALLTYCDEPWFSEFDSLVDDWLSFTIKELAGYTNPHADPW